MQAELLRWGVKLHEKDKEMDEMDIGELIRKKKKNEHTIKFVIFQWV